MPSQSPEPKTRTKPSANLRKLLYIPLLLVISWLAYNLIASDSSLPVIQSQASSGHSAHPKTHVADLPADYLPEVGKHRSSGRLVVVGDVHGMKNSLEELLKKIKFVEGEDHLVLAGDMVSKGPDSAGVVDLAVRLGATGVRGNHEERVIVAQAALEGKESANAETGGEDVGGLEKRENKDKELIKELGRRRIKWLKECPVILRVGKIGGMGQVVVVHAGLAPGVELEMQDRDMVMNMRTIGEDNVPSDEHSGKPWSKVWNKYQKSLPKKQRTTVIYGHDSKRGLQEKKHSIGIDTGCVKGGKLTAIVIAGGHSEHTHKIVHVNCKDERGH